MRSATLDIYRPEHAAVIERVDLRVERLSPRLNGIVPPGTVAEQVATGFPFTEGPVWTVDGALLFSSPNTNVIYRWTPDGVVSVFRTKSGYTGLDIGRYTQPGSNGLASDPQGRLTICQHGNRQVLRVEPHGNTTVLADSFDGRRLNSPNDLVYATDGTLYFTDPPFGLPDGDADTKKELPFSGVFAVADGRIRVVTDELRGPNGVALSPDRRQRYVGNWDPERKVVMRHDTALSGARGAGELFCDLTAEPGEDAIDGLEVDRAGNVYVCGPGGIWILSPQGNGLIPGSVFPDFDLPDETGATHRLSELQGNNVLVLMLGRGEHCPRERQHQREMLQFHEWCPVAFTDVVTVLPNSLHDVYRMKIATGAHWTFLADTDLMVQSTLDIREYTDPHHDATVPHTVILSPGLVVEKVYVGYWFWGRPSVYQLWADLQDLFRRTKPHFDPTLPEARTAWESATLAPT
jgi:sugar lactone lactonase YvrE/peroxiredoxin